MLLMCTIGWIDYRTGYGISMFLFYGGPIMLTVWYCDRSSAVLMALLSAIVWWWADWQTGHPYISDWLQAYETCMRLCFFLSVVMGGSAMKTKNDAVEAQLETVNRLRQLEREIVAASEVEQQRIGCDLHDGLCQFLAGIGCAATSLKDDLQSHFASEAEAAAEIEELLRDAVMQARNVARGLAPVHVDEAGLVAAIEELAANTSRMMSIDCEFHGDDAFPEPTREVATHLYRIAQEALNNAVKHAHATEINISLKFAENLELSIEDNGVGLPADAEHSGGMGLKTMNYRARSIGGELHVQSELEKGTAVTCIVPADAVINPSETHVLFGS